LPDRSQIPDISAANLRDLSVSHGRKRVIRQSEYKFSKTGILLSSKRRIIRHMIFQFQQLKLDIHLQYFTLLKIIARNFRLLAGDSLKRSAYIEPLAKRS